MAERPDLGDLGWAPRLREERHAAGSPAITGIVHTLNEERNLDDCLRSLAWVDELLVVDMHSEDATRDIAERHGARVLLHEPVGYVEPARNFSHEHATGDWLLVLDADERAIEPLARELDRIAREDAADVVDVPTDNWLCGRFLRATGWAGDWHARFYRRGMVVWSPRIHATPEIRGRRLRLPIELAIQHFAMDDLHAVAAKTNRYTDKEADATADDPPPTWAEAVRAARQEIDLRWSPDVDGTQSVALSVLMFHYRFLAHAKAWERHGFPDDVGAPATASEALRDLAGDARLDHRRGIEAFEEGEVATARGLLESSLRESVDLDLLSDLAVVHHAEGDPARAEALLRFALMLDPEHPGARANLAALGAG